MNKKIIHTSEAALMISSFYIQRTVRYLTLALMAVLISASWQYTQAQEPVRWSTYKGKVLLRNLDGSTVPFTEGRVGLLNEQGRMVDSVAIQQDGSYKFNMPNQPHTIQVLVHGYQFSPSPLRFNPRGPGSIPTITATAQRAGGPPNRGRLPAPTGLGNDNNATVVNGSIEVSLIRHVNSSSRADVANRHFLIKDAETGRLLSTIRTNGNGQFRYNDTTGRRITIEPRPDANSNLRYVPTRVATTIPRGSANVNITYYEANETGTGDLNVSKDRTTSPNVLEPVVELKTHPHSVITGHPIRLVASLGRDKHQPSFRYTFLLRYDYDRNWRTIADRQRSPELTHTLSDSGGFAYKVVVYSDGAVLGTSREGRAISLQHTPPTTSPNQRGVARVPSIKELIPFPMVGEFPKADHIVLHVGIDSVEGQVGLQRWISANAYLKKHKKAPTPLPRNQARVTFLVRHESDREWTIVTRNSPTLEWAWSPPRSGKWLLRVDLQQSPEYENYPMHGRGQIEFTAYNRQSNQNQGTSADRNTQTRPGQGLKAR